MKRAWIALKEMPHYRRDAFAEGAKRIGYQPEFSLTHRPGPHDLLIIWNRYGASASAAALFEQEGLPVLVAENGYLGNEFAGSRWYAISRNLHNGAGSWNHYGSSRWDSLGVELQPFRLSGEELVLLPQRGIGSEGVAMPRNWEFHAQQRSGGRVRSHPGLRPCTPLEQDLSKAYAVYTWGSGAAIKALLWGIPVYSDMPKWIAAPASARYGEELNRSEFARLEMFRRLAWAMWRLEEIENGQALDMLL